MRIHSHTPQILGLLILIALSLSIISPLSINISFTHDGTYLVTLDVCHASSPPLSVNTDMPYQHESPSQLAVLEATDLYETLDPKFSPLLITLQIDHPPRV